MPMHGVDGRYVRTMLAHKDVHRVSVEENKSAEFGAFRQSDPCAAVEVPRPTRTGLWVRARRSKRLPLQERDYWRIVRACAREGTEESCMTNQAMAGRMLTNERRWH